ncbi:hypothetical protein AQS8620_02772 [Aquimixticola soesokkakensis]|uniref:Uncharacterized protein n=1 Tax=Aquimixticola soesokkakensis TaxID=1519096 RepID=A0A1Y5TIB1_9RHOB|nr:hypothetical protein [Aquimixticola soesokkakensis]SLN61023.1 hypothetical protein AQS8620_02772 [Aquimixticola soesokkakensis]
MIARAPLLVRWVVLALVVSVFAAVLAVASIALGVPLGGLSSLVLGVIVGLSVMQGMRWLKLGKYRDRA